MWKKAFLAVALLTIGLMGCIGYNQEWDPSWTDDFEHEKRHFRAFWQDLASIHRFVDRHLFNFDETDPGRY